MQTPVLSTIAQVLFESTSTLNYARIVSELEQVLARLKPDHLTTSWDCDDLVFFDLAETRIGLGFSEFAGAAVASCLTVSVGPCPGARQQPADPGHDVLCSRIVERLQTRYVPLAVLWNQTDAEITADLIDALTEALPSLAAHLPATDRPSDPLRIAADASAATPVAMQRIRPAAPPADPIAQALILQDRARPRAAAPVRLADPAARQPAAAGPSPAANDMPVAIASRAQELMRLREALYPDMFSPQPEPRMSTQMRLAVHAMNATLIMVWMPLGAAVMTYSILKGEDLRVSGRIMALTGTFLAFAQALTMHPVTMAIAGT